MRQIKISNKRISQTLVPCTILACLLAGHAQAADELDFLNQSLVRSERVVESQHRVLWILPFETTQYLPLHPTTAMREAMAAQQAGRYIEAIGMLDAAAGEDASIELQLLRASYYLQGDQLQTAHRILDDTFVRAPNSPEAYAIKAMAYLQEGKLDAAANAAQMALKNGRTPMAVRVSSYVLQAQGKLPEAQSLMAELNANGPDALNFAREAEFALSQNNKALAATRLAEARKLDASSPYVMAVSGLHWLLEDKLQLAQGAFEQALRRDPEDAKSLLGMGLVKARLGQHAASLEYLRKAAKASPDNAMIQTYLGRALQESGQTGEAQAAYRTAIKHDAQDPVPRIYLAQLLNESGQPAAALQGLRDAEKLKTSRGVYRGENLLNEDEQTIQSNLAMVYRKLGMNELAWQTLSDGAGDKNAQTLKNQAEILQGQRFAETARRSLALQSLFNDRRDALPVSLDVYGDGGGQTGATAPQSGAIGGLSGQASLGNYGALFDAQTRVEANAIVGNRQTWGEQLRAAVGGEQFGFSLAQQHYQTEGFSSFNGLDNTTWQGVLKWDPLADTRLFLSYQDFRSERSMVLYPALIQLGTRIDEKSWVARLGMSQRLNDGGELRALLSHQSTDYKFEYDVAPGSFTPGEAQADSVGLQYRQNFAAGVLIAGLEDYREHSDFPLSFSENKIHAGQVYVAQATKLSEHWDLDWSLGWSWLKNNDLVATFDTELTRWIPHLGLVYTPSPATHLRFALGQHLGLPGVGGASLAPVETAGLINTRPSEIGKLTKSAGIAFDHRLALAWLASGEAQIRDVREPVSDGVSQYLEKSRYEDGRLGLTWMPMNNAFTTTLDAGYERRTNESAGLVLDSIAEQRLRDVKLSFKWFANSHLSLKGEISRNWVDGDYQFSSPYRDASTQLDTSMRWQLKQGAIDLGVRNLLDDKFEYTESDPLAPRFSKGRFVFGNISWRW